MQSFSFLRKADRCRLTCARPGSPPGTLGLQTREGEGERGTVGCVQSLSSSFLLQNFKTHFCLHQSFSFPGIRCRELQSRCVFVPWVADSRSCLVVTTGSLVTSPWLCSVIFCVHEHFGWGRKPAVARVNAPNLPIPEKKTTCESVSPKFSIACRCAAGLLRS